MEASASSVDDLYDSSLDRASNVLINAEVGRRLCQTVHTRILRLLAAEFRRNARGSIFINIKIFSVKLDASVCRECPDLLFDASRELFILTL